MTFERTELIKSFDGAELFFRCFTPKKRDHKDAKIRGLVLGVHGFGEHSGRYAAVAEAICAKGLAFAIFDNRGHGKSGPVRGDADNLHAMILDVLFMVNHAKRWLGISARNDMFYGILGHSFGGLLVTYAAAILSDACPPIFLSAPCYEIKEHIPSWKRLAAQTLPRVSPTLRIPVGMDAAKLSENPANNAAFKADELNLSSVSSRLGHILLDAVDEPRIRQSVSLVRAPVKIVCGSEDKLTNSEIVREIAPLYGVPGSSFSMIHGAGHEIFNEKEPARSEAFAHLESWLDGHLKAFPIESA